MEDAGILVVLNGVVGNNSHRKLNPQKFQGFCLSDEVAPLIFVNAADFQTAQVFSLAHGLAHVFLATSGISKLHNFQATHSRLETFCDAAAAEFLVPKASLLQFGNRVNGTSSIHGMAKHFKVSELVIGRRLLDLELITRSQFLKILETSRQAAKSNPNRNRPGGSFRNTQRNRIGKRFGGTVARAVKRGELQYTEGYFLTGLTGKTFEEMIEQFGVKL